jgi:molybdopterin molybdotransferase
VITEEEALAHILKSVKTLPPRRVQLAQARERFAAADIFARVSLPVFDNSAMDGYAVVAASCKPGQGQRVIGEQPAGVDRKMRIAAGEAVRIFTGAPMPDGADAVVMQEDVRCDGSELFINAKVEPGEFVRRRGSDLSEGQKILSAGERIRPQTLALLAAQGLSEIDVGGEARAAIITTGDELVPPGEAVGAGQIYESNSTLVRALFEECGVSVGAVEHCADDVRAI